MEEQVKLWQLIEVWLEQQGSEWVVSEHGTTYLIENGEWKFYIGPDYIAGYPSCGDNLIAADPEFFDKLTERMNHVWDCGKCIATQLMEKQLRADFNRPIDLSISEAANNYEKLKKTLNACYRVMGKPLPYSTIRIDP